MTTSKYDMMYGRQGGRIVPFAADAHAGDAAATCDECGKPLTNAEARYHRECTQAEPAPADQLSLFGDLP